MVSSNFNLSAAPWNKGVPWLQDASVAYLARVRHKTAKALKYPEYNEQFQRFCAHEGKKSSYTPDDPRTARSYEAFRKDLINQATMLFELGVTMTIIEGEPYASSDDMRLSLLRQKDVLIRRMDPMPTRHPLAFESPFGVSYLELFRLVHDVAIHAAFGFSFAARGEEAAAQTHILMCSRAATPAVVAETRMQSAALYAGDEACNGSDHILRPCETGYIPLSERTFAPQFAFYPPVPCLSVRRWSAASRIRLCS